MKKSLFIVFLLLFILSLASDAKAQVFNIVQEPVCWTTPSQVDSSLNRYILISSLDNEPPRTLSYVNASGLAVTVAGGTLKAGYCGSIVASMLVDSIGVVQDSIIVLYADNAEITRDTVGPFGGGTGAVDDDWLQWNSNHADDINNNIYTNGFVNIGITGKANPLYVEIPNTTTGVRFGSGNSGDIHFYRQGMNTYVLNEDGFVNDFEGMVFGAAGNNASFYTNGEQVLYLDSDGEVRFNRYGVGLFEDDTNVSPYVAGFRNDGFIYEIKPDSLLVTDPENPNNSIDLATALTRDDHLGTHDQTLTSNRTVDAENYHYRWDFTALDFDSYPFMINGPDNEIGIYADDGAGTMYWLADYHLSTDIWNDGIKNIASKTRADKIDIGNSSDSTYINGDKIFINSPNLVVDNTNTQAIAIDPVTGEVERVDVGGEDMLSEYLALDTLSNPVVFNVTNPQSINVINFVSVPTATPSVINISSAPVGRYMFHLKNTDVNTVDFSNIFLDASGDLVDEGSHYQIFKDKMWDCYSDATNYYCNTPSELIVFDPFVFSVDTRNISDGSTNSFTFMPPFKVDAVNDFTIAWGDGIEETFIGDTLRHVYATEGIYNITIEGRIGGWEFANTGDKDKILEIIEWGDFILNSSAFFGCTNLTVSAIDGPIIENLESAFRECTSISTLDVTAWNTSSVTSMFNTFLDCSNLISIDASDWNTSANNNLAATFSNCSSLTTLNIEGWNISKVTTIRDFISNCSNLTTLDVTAWNTSLVKDASRFASGCSSLVTLNTTNWNTSNITSFREFVSGCSSLVTLNTTNWNTSNVTTFQTFANGCSSLIELDVSGWNTSNVTNFLNFVLDCTSLEILDCDSWDVSKSTSFLKFARGCTSLTTLDVSGWTLKPGATMREFATNCTSLTTLDVSGWTTTGVISFQTFVTNCTNLTDLQCQNWDISSVTNFTLFASGCNIPTSSYDQILLNWGSQIVENNLNVNFGTSTYTIGSPSESARTSLINNNSWTIIDGGGI